MSQEYSQKKISSSITFEGQDKCTALWHTVFLTLNSAVYYTIGECIKLLGICILCMLQVFQLQLMREQKQIFQPLPYLTLWDFLIVYNVYFTYILLLAQ